MSETNTITIQQLRRIDDMLMQIVWTTPKPSRITEDIPQAVLCDVRAALGAPNNTDVEAAHVEIAYNMRRVHGKRYSTRVAVGSLACDETRGQVHLEVHNRYRF